MAAVAMIAGACSTGGATTAPSAAVSAKPSAAATGAASARRRPARRPTRSVSRTRVVSGNGWREEMICSAKAQAVKAGNVSKVTVIHRDTDAAGELCRHPRRSIPKSVNAIIINPADPAALNAAIKDAAAAGIVVVAIDASVTAPGRLQPLQRPAAVRLPRRVMAVQAARRQGCGRLACAASPATRPTLTATSASRRPSSRESRDHGRQGNRDQMGPGHGRRPRSTTSSPRGVKFDGIWTSGIDNVIVDALKTAKHALRADRRRGRRRLRDPAPPKERRPRKALP